MKFGLRVPLCENSARVAELVGEAERSGFTHAWLPDSQIIWRDVWVAMGVVASSTSDIRLGTNVTNPITRHVSVTASAAAAAQETSNGRVVLGIGVGDSSVRLVGERPARLAELSEYVTELRRLWSGEVVKYGTREVRLRAGQVAPPPVYVSATGPKMLQLAGELGDGVIALAGISQESLAYTTENVGIGARKAGRRVRDVDIVTGLFADVGPYRPELARPYAAGWALRHRESLEASGARIPDAKPVDVYPDLSHAEDWDEAMDRTSWVPDDVLEEFCDRFCLMGSATDVADKVRALESRGVTSLYIRGFYSYELPWDLCQSFSRDVLPSFR